MFKKKKDKKKSFLNVFFSVDMLKRDIDINKQLYSNLKKQSIKESFEESFEEAMERQRIKPEDLKDKYNFFRKNAYTFFTISLIPIIFLIFKAKNFGFETLILTGFFIYFFLNAFKFSMHCYQIKHKKLNVIREILKSPKNIFIIKPYNHE